MPDLRARILLPAMLLCALLPMPVLSAGPENPPAVMPRSGKVLVSDNLDIDINIYPAKGNQLILWIAPSYEFRQGHKEMAALLAASGFETWMVDMNEAQFLSHDSQAMRDINGRYIAEIVDRAHAKTGKSIAIMADANASIPALRAMREWQLLAHETQYLQGAILFSPNLYSGIPQLGFAPDFMPIVSATNMPIMILQGEKNGARLYLDRLLEQLYSAGSQTYLRMLPGVVGLFYGEQRTPIQDKSFYQVPDFVRTAFRVFGQVKPPASALPLPEKIITVTHFDTKLKPFKGNRTPSEITLLDATGLRHVYKDFRGQVTLVNFWATWCPPCLQEIPSLNRLVRKMQGKPLRLVSIDFGEPQKNVTDFLKKVQVDFPVLLDSDGSISNAWKVVVLPSTFVIGKDGRIVYGINASIEWDSPEIIALLNKLMRE